MTTYADVVYWPGAVFEGSAECAALPPKSDVDLFCSREGVVDLDAQISNGALDLSMPQKELHGSQVAGTAIDQGRLGPAKGMRAEQMWVQSPGSKTIGGAASVRSRALRHRNYCGRSTFRGWRVVQHAIRINDP